MTDDLFQKVLIYLGFDPSEIRSQVLKLTLVDGQTISEAADSTGYSRPSARALTHRVTTDLRRISDLTGVNVSPTIRRGTPGRKANRAQ